MKRLVLLPLLFVFSAVSARADVASRSSDSLGTRINGVLGGRCQSGLCRISGGSDSGRNRFHRLTEFDTRGAIQGVSIDSDGARNLVLGVTAAEGSFIDKSVSLSSPAHLFVLSPGGIQLMPGASFQQIPQLTLSTAPQLRFPGGVFDVFNTSFAGISMLTGDPLPGALGLFSGDLGDKRPWIRMDGVSIDVDESLLVDAPGGGVDVLNSRLSVSNDAGDGGSLTLTGDLVRVGQGSQLLATGTGQGGLVQVGGSWQNSDPTVRQASQTWMQPGSVVDASSTGSGDGGTVVIWSDLNQPAGGTVAQGTLLARGGSFSGNGGRIETSGPVLVAEPERLDVTAPNGLAGEWLLDPYNITIGAGNQQTDIVSQNLGGSLFESSNTGSFVNIADIRAQLETNVSVAIQTGPANDNTEAGNITWQSGAPLDYSASNATTGLALNASGYIELNSDITVGPGGLSLFADTGYVAAASDITLALGGDLSISAGDTTQTDKFFAATLTGSGDLSKLGSGRLILSGNSPAWSGNTTIQAGMLRATAANALGTASFTKADSGAMLELDGGLIFAENIELDGGKLVNVSGDNTAASPIIFRNSSTIDVRQDSLTLSDSLTTDVGVPSNLTVEGSGDLDAIDFLDLSDGAVNPTKGIVDHVGSGVLRFRSTVNASQIRSTGGGTVWMDQPAGDEVLPTGSSFFLSNSSILRRDSSETVDGTSLELGQGGGGISVGDGFSLIWDAPITGIGSFTKSGEGKLTFPASANITYTGSTLVSSGRLDIFSSEPMTATCAGTGVSNRCGGAVVIGGGGSGGGGNSTDGAGGTEGNTPQQPNGPGDSPKPKPQNETDTEPKKDSDQPKVERDKELVDAVDETVAVLPANQTTTTTSSSPVTDSNSSTSAAGASTTAQSQSVGSSFQVDLGSSSDSSATTASVTTQAPLVAVNTQTVAPEQAAAQLQQSDEAATTRTATLLGLDQNDQTILPSTPTVEDLQNVLSRVQREGLVANPAVLQVRFTQSALGVTDVEGAGIAVRTSEDFQQLNASAAANPYLAEDFEAKAFMRGDGDQLFASAAGVAQTGALLEPPARSELLQATNGQNEDAFLDLTLVGSDAPVEARRVPLNRAQFGGLLKALYRQLSRQEPLATDDPASPSRQLHALLVAPILESLQGQDVETLLIAADQGLQAVPFAALSDGSSFFGEKYAFALTPSLALTPLAPSQSDSGAQLALGASEFETLAPLPLVPQELEQLGASTGADRYLNEEFSPQVLLNGAADQRYDRVHVATHADFRPGGPAQSVLHTGTGPMSMEQLAQLRSKRLETPLDLIVLSACRTLLGDPDSELGFAGLALQAGARSAVGTLWYVDDVVTSAFFVQFYRLLDQGLPKAEALQRTRQLFASGAIQLQGDVVVGADQAPLLTSLTPAQRRRIAGGVQNPYFWSGIQLIGSPW